MPKMLGKKRKRVIGYITWTRRYLGGRDGTSSVSYYLANNGTVKQSFPCSYDVTAPVDLNIY